MPSFDDSEVLAPRGSVAAARRPQDRSLSGRQLSGGAEGGCPAAVRGIAGRRAHRVGAEVPPFPLALQAPSGTTSGRCITRESSQTGTTAYCGSGGGMRVPPSS